MKLLLILSMTLLCGAASAGNFVNNGIDQLDEKGDAVWFVGSREIQACVEVDPNFGVDLHTAADTIQNAFSIWNAYLLQKGVKRALGSAGLEVSTSVKIHSGCSGTEDIAFYLGVRNNFLVQAALGFRRPLAFSERTSFDETLLWGKGFIWIAPPSDFAGEKLDWSRDNHLLGALLHEIGHVYGCGHIGSTIMRAELSENILDPQHDFLHVMTKIDSGKQLYFCDLCGGAFQGTILHNDVISKLVGRQVTGTPKVELTLEDDGAHLPHGIFKVRDSKGTVTLNFESRFEIADVFSDTLLFHIPVSLDPNQRNSFATRNGGQVYLATLSFGKEHLNVIYKRNMEFMLSVNASYADQITLLDTELANKNLVTLTPKN